MTDPKIFRAEPQAPAEGTFANGWESPASPDQILADLGAMRKELDGPAVVYPVFQFRTDLRFWSTPMSQAMLIRVDHGEEPDYNGDQTDPNTGPTTGEQER